MDQIKIGRFIKEKRNEKGITQSELADRLNITDRAVSKWERGVCLPDADNIILLCELLDISVNDLFSGEVVNVKNNERILEKNLIEMTKLKEEKDRELLTLEIVIGFTASLFLLVNVLLASYLEMDDFLKIVLVAVGFIVFIIGIGYAIRIEQIAGYYECAKCHHKYVPKYSSVLWAMHINRTRYMKCPKCGKKSWNKKVLSGNNKI